MCGFVGFVGGTDNQSEVLTKMMDRIVHRGPDMGGQFIESVAFEYTRGRKEGRNVQAISTESAPL